MDAGLTIPPWAGRRRADALRHVKAKGIANDEPCCICGQPIDYTLSYPAPWSCSVQHLRSQRDFPKLRWDPSNWGPAHLDCNTSEGARVGTSLGLMSE